MDLPFRYRKREVVPGGRVEEKESTFFFFFSLFKKSDVGHVEFKDIE